MSGQRYPRDLDPKRIDDVDRAAIEMDKVSLELFHKHMDELTVDESVRLSNFVAFLAMRQAASLMPAGGDTSELHRRAEEFRQKFES